MKSLGNRKYLYSLLAVIGLSAAGLMFYDSTSAAQKGFDDELSRLPVAVLELEKRDFYSISEKFPGKISAFREADQGFDRPGIVAKIFVDEGSKVKKGQILAQLDARSIMARLASAKAALHVAQARFSEVEARLDMTANKYKRSKRLFSKGHISKEKFESEEFALRSAEASVIASKAGIQQAKAGLDMVSADLNLVTLHAPFDGLITKRFVDEGASLGGAKPVIHIIEDQKLVIHVGVSYALAQTLKAGQIYSFKGQIGTVSAKLRSVVNMIDQSTQTVMAIFDVQNTDMAAAGEFAYLTLDHKIEASGFWVPTGALAESRRGLWSLYAIEKDDSGNYRTSRREVQVLYTGHDRVFVRGTVRHGEKIIKRAAYRIVPHQLVSISDEFMEQKK